MTTPLPAACPYPTVAVGVDHGGFVLKEPIIAWLQARGVQVIDCGTHDDTRTDHPLYADAVAQALQHGQAQLGILCCGTGVGIAMRANRYPGIYAGVAYTPAVARLLKEHNNANILCFGGRTQTWAEVEAGLMAFWSAHFLGERYAARLKQLDAPLVGRGGV